MAGIDLNSGSGFVYGRPESGPTVGARLVSLIDDALAAERAASAPRDYLGASRIGEPCARRLCFEAMAVPIDPDKAFSGRILRVFEVGHLFEEMTVRWLRLAGFDLRNARRDGSQFGFSTAGGRFRGHIDGVIVAGPDLGFSYPVLFEHKAVKGSTWTEIVKRGVHVAAPVYWAQVQVYMAYLAVERTLFAALNKDTQALAFEIVDLDSGAAQELSDKAVAVLRAVESGELLPRVAASRDFHLCRMCPFERRCWGDDTAAERGAVPPPWWRAS